MDLRADAVGGCGQFLGRTGQQPRGLVDSAGLPHEAVGPLPDIGERSVRLDDGAADSGGCLLHGLNEEVQVGLDLVDDFARLPRQRRHRRRTVGHKLSLGHRIE